MLFITPFSLTVLICFGCRKDINFVKRVFSTQTC